MGSQLGCWCKCTFKLFILLVVLAEFVALPTVGLVWWFVTKPPQLFMLTCFGMFFLWIGFGVFFFLACLGLGKYRQLTNKAHKYAD